MNSVPSTSEENTIDIRDIFNILRRRLKIIIGFTALGLGLVLVYLLLTTPLYTASTEIRIDPGVKSPIGEAILPGIGSDTAGIESEVRLLKSTSIALRVIKKLKLLEDGEFQEQSALSSFMSIISRMLGFAKSEAGDAGPVEVEEQLNALTRAFLKRLKVKRVGLTYIIAVSFTSKDPRKAAMIANQIADSYLVDQLESRFEATKRANTWLNERLGKLRADLKRSETAVELYRANNNLVGESGSTPFDSQLKKLNEELVLARVKMREKQSLLEQAREIIASKGKLITIDAVAQSETVKKLQAEQARVAGRLAELTTRFTPKHPKVLNVQGEQRDLNRQIETEAKNIVRNLDNEHKIFKRRVSSIGQSLQDLKNKTKGARSASIGLRELERESGANRAIYEAFLGKFKETSEQETLETNDARVISKATSPPDPSYPKKKLTMILSLLGFAAMGVGLAFLLEHLDNSFKSGEQLEEHLKLAHLASVPKLTGAELKADNGQKIPLVRFVGLKPLSAYAEAMRNIKVGLQLFNIDHPPKVVLVTSAVPNEGKSTLTCNLAQHMASSGLRTLLIDCDLRNPSLAQLLGHEGRAGLLELLSGKSNLEQVLVRENNGFDFIQSAYIPQNSEEILGSDTMTKMLENLRPHYDVILLDAMPVAPVVDTKVLVKSVDAILMVVEWNKTPREVIKNSLKKLNAPNEKLAGVVLNKIDMKRMASYGGYGYSYYHKNYGNYYGAGK